MRRAWVAVAFAGAVLLAAVLLAAIGTSPAVPLDPQSASPDGSKALTRLLGRYGATVHRVGTVADAGRSPSAAPAATAVVVTSPEDYQPAQLRRLQDANTLLVLIAPGKRSLAAVLPGATVEDGDLADPEPGCTDRGARAAGLLDAPPGATLYGYPGSCYGGLLIVTARVAVLGSADLLRNDRLADSGVAALDIDTITCSRSIARVTWLLPGSDASARPTASVWQLFPPAVRRAFWWLLAVGALLACWRGRRLGAPVREPLPVVVRAAEVVEGHGRLYRRAGARDRAGAALRQGAAARLAIRLGLPRGAGAEQVALAAAPLAGTSPAQLQGLLAGPPPADDAALVRLARDLDAVAAEVDGRVNR